MKTALKQPTRSNKTMWFTAASPIWTSWSRSPRTDYILKCFDFCVDGFNVGSPLFLIPISCHFPLFIQPSLQFSVFPLTHSVVYNSLGKEMRTSIQACSYLLFYRRARMSFWLALLDIYSITPLTKDCVSLGFRHNIRRLRHNITDE